MRRDNKLFGLNGKFLFDATNTNELTPDRVGEDRYDVCDQY
jgi:hypothetical protein